MKDEKREILRLRNEIKEHNYRYYVLDAPEISDNQYDALMQRLRALEARHPELRNLASPSVAVGGEVAPRMGQIRHMVRMDSLQDVFDLSAVRFFCAGVRERFGDAVSFVVEPKIDGLSVSLEYFDGRLVRAATRGNGLVGEDVTENVKMIDSVPRVLKKTIKRLLVRGEVFTPTHVFQQLVDEQRRNQETCFKNARNAAAGSLRQKDPEITRDRRLDIFVFNLQAVEGVELTGHKESIEFLNDLGFKTVPVFGGFQGDAEIIAQIERIGKAEAKRDFNIDGAVVKVDNLRYREVLGTTAKHPKWAIAFKYTPIEIQTEVLDVEISVGRTGVLTPIAILRPVLIDGSMVSRAVLHNQDFIKKKMLNVGCSVLVRKAGDVIPEIVSVVRNSSIGYFKIPRQCPFCLAEAFEENVDLVCQNPDCPGQLVRRIMHFTSRDGMNIEGLGPGIIEKLVKKGLLSSVADVYYLQMEDLVDTERLGEKSAENLLAQIEVSKLVGPARLLFGLGVKNVGAKTARDLIARLGDLERLFVVQEEELLALPGIGEITVASLLNFFALPQTRVCVNRLKVAGVTLKSALPVSSETKVSCVLTGSFESFSRAELEERLGRAGVNVLGNVSAKTNYLLVGNNPGGKLAKAEQLKVPLVFEKDLERFLIWVVDRVGPW
ncbi:MAG: NAD-dependent DNA ligase LigA [Oscillospiraceae bacterium]|jgi:DNA ligase (NAD+)|nr:NAD-dependent DNA ligase LigA [Oscillospiraceae bacterium]